MIIRDFVNDRPRIIFDEDIVKYGWEKAYIIGNLCQKVNGDGSSPQKEDLYKFFKIFPKQRFYELIEELIVLGILYEEK